MTTRRLLPLLNLAGCLLLTATVIFQWLQERDLGQRITGLTEQLATVRDQYDSEKSRTTVLESDIAQLKAATESTVRAREETEAALAKMTAERESQVATTQQTHQAQTALWEKAITDRDTKLTELATTLTATRKRLDEAISKLKQAATRAR